MASLESLPPDERAVLQLVLQRGRTFDDIAEMLAIDRAAVRDRALRALDALGPQTRVAPERRALITDYLLGQLPPRVAEMTREQLASSAPDRAWARVLAAELTPLARDPLPEIPLEGSIFRSGGEHAPGAAARLEESEYDAMPARAGTGPAAQADDAPADEGYGRPDRPQRPSSRRGGAVVIGAVAAVVVAGIVVGVVLGTSGSSPHHSTPPPSTTPATTHPSTTPATTPTTASKTGKGSVKALATIKLSSPSGGKENGEAEIATQSGKPVVIIAARNVPANSGHNAYAVWLSDGKGHDVRLGFVNPAVKSNGVLETAGPVPATVHLTSYDELLVSLETKSTPAAPSSTVVLKGAYHVG